MTDEDSAARLARLATTLESNGHGHTLNRLDYLTELIESAERMRTAAVDQARREGASWQAIAANIGTSKQGAQQRYGRKSSC